MIRRGFSAVLRRSISTRRPFSTAAFRPPCAGAPAPGASSHLGDPATLPADHLARCIYPMPLPEPKIGSNAAAASRPPWAGAPAAGASSNLDDPVPAVHLARSTHQMPLPEPKINSNAAAASRPPSAGAPAAGASSDLDDPATVPAVHLARSTHPMPLPEPKIGITKRTSASDASSHLDNPPAIPANDRDRSIYPQPRPEPKTSIINGTAASRPPWAGAPAPGASSQQDNPLIVPAKDRSLPEPHLGTINGASAPSATVGMDTPLFLSAIGEDCFPVNGLKAIKEISGVSSIFMDARRRFSTSTDILVPAPVEEFGEHRYGLGSNDTWTMYDVFFASRPIFETIQGNLLIPDAEKARLWEESSQKVFQNIIWLAQSNTKHGINIAPSLISSNIMISASSCSVRLLRAEGYTIDNANHFPTSALKAAAALYHSTVKSQSALDSPMDFKHLMDKISDLGNLATIQELRSIFFDASLLSSSLYTRALDRVEYLYRRAYLYSDDPVDTKARENTMCKVATTVCRDGSMWSAYMRNVPITAHFHSICVQMGNKHRTRIMTGALGDIAKLLQAQEGHQQLGAMRNTSWHLCEPVNINRFPAIFPQAAPSSSTGAVPSSSKAAAPSSNTTSVQITREDISKYHRYHFNMTMTTIFEETENSETAKNDLNIESLFGSDSRRIP